MADTADASLVADGRASFHAVDLLAGRATALDASAGSRRGHPVSTWRTARRTERPPAALLWDGGHRAGG